MGTIIGMSFNIIVIDVIFYRSSDLKIKCVRIPTSNKIR